jgi:hypothetical protein
LWPWRSGVQVPSLTLPARSRPGYTMFYSGVRHASAPVAQLAEQGTLNPKVEGSIPSGRILSSIHGPSSRTVPLSAERLTAFTKQCIIKGSTGTRPHDEGAERAEAFGP